VDDTLLPDTAGGSMTMQSVAASLAVSNPATSRPPYGFFIGQHIVAVTDAESCNEAATQGSAARQTCDRVIAHLPRAGRQSSAFITMRRSKAGEK
jgi:hypothetical protein